MPRESIPNQGVEEGNRRNHFEVAKKLLVQLLAQEEEAEKLEEKASKGNRDSERQTFREGAQRSREAAYGTALQIYQEWERAGKPGTGFFADEAKRREALFLLVDFGPWKKAAFRPIPTIQEYYSENPSLGTSLLIYCPDKVAEINRVTAIMNTSERDGVTWRRGFNRWGSIVHPAGGSSQAFRESPDVSGDLFRLE